MRTLIAKDAEGKPLKAVLEIKQGLIGDDPAVSLKVGTGWLTVPHGWEMLEDRLGIAVYIEDPESWHTGNPALPTIQGVTWNSNPPAGKSFVLRLTTVIEADVMLDAEAPSARRRQLNSRGFDPATVRTTSSIAQSPLALSITRRLAVTAPTP